MARANYQLVILSLISFAVLAQHIASGQVTDRTREPRAAGSNVVFATVALIQDSEIFPDDNRLLRRIAYVESRDGVDVNTFRDDYFGGIWQVDMDIFNKTLNTDEYPELLNIYAELFTEFGIDWSAARWENLLAPFFSALAARIYFSIIDGESIPAAGDLQAQARYWKMFYNPTGTEQFFIDSVNEFELEECPIRGIDLAFVFDSSGSVGESNFEREKQFAVDVVNTFTIGPGDTRIANIAFSGFANISFFFDTHQNKTAVTDALRQVEYFDVRVPPHGVSTYTADALTRLRNEVFTVQGGARERGFGIPRVAVIITDGRSNINQSLTIPSAQDLHDDNVIVFAVGIGNKLNMDELDAIGSDPKFVILLSSFDVTEFASLQRTISAEACVVPAPIDIEETLEGVLENGDLSFFQFQLPTSGMTIRLRGRSGRTVLYASDKIRNPNSAYYDFRYDSQVDVGGFFVSPDMLRDRNPRRTRRITESFSNTTLFVSIEGVQESNAFTLSTSFGDNSSASKLYSGACVLTTLLLLAISLVL